MEILAFTHDAWEGNDYHSSIWHSQGSVRRIDRSCMQNWEAMHVLPFLWKTCQTDAPLLTETQEMHGNDKFHCSTQQPTAKRNMLQSSSSEDTSTVSLLATQDQVEAASDRLCGDLHLLEQHETSMIMIKNYWSCEICRKPAYFICKKCPNEPVLHWKPPKDSTDNISCHVKYHNTLRFGIARAESTKRKWKEPTEEASEAHVKQMKHVCDAITVANATVLPSST